MREYIISVTLNVNVLVEASNQAEAEERAIELAESGYFNGVNSVTAHVVK